MDRPLKGEAKVKKKFHAVYFDGITFGMEIETGTKAYEYFKKSVKDEMAYSIFGDPIKVLAVPHMAVAAIMEGAHWLVSTEKYLNKFYIDGFKKSEEIYIKYSDDPIDFRTRKKQLL